MELTYGNSQGTGADLVRAAGLRWLDWVFLGDIPPKFEH